MPAKKGIAAIEALMDAQNTDVLGINHRNRRYFVSGMNALYPEVRSFVFSPLMAEVCRATPWPRCVLILRAICH